VTFVGIVVVLLTNMFSQPEITPHARELLQGGRCRSHLAP
jgi:hypothetical protein